MRFFQKKNRDLSVPSKGDIPSGAESPPLFPGISGAGPGLPKQENDADIRNRAQAFVEEFARPFLSSRDDILEIGCGPGWCSEPLSRFGRHLICTDLSADGLERTRGRLAGRKNVFFEKLLSNDLRQFGDASFDFAFSSELFMSLEPDRIYSYLREIRRVLKPNARGVLRFANLDSEEGWREFVKRASLPEADHVGTGKLRYQSWGLIERFMADLNLSVLHSDRESRPEIVVAFEKRNPGGAPRF
jgi:SAM-dependent methyltransferase